MENQQQNFLFGLSSSSAQEQTKSNVHQNDLQNLQKVILQSFKYCQAKRSKNKYIRLKKIQQMKLYQKKLLSIIKKKSQQSILLLQNYSTQLISNEQTIFNKNAKIEEQSLQKLKQKISTIKKQYSNEGQNQKDNLMRHKFKKITFECEQVLEKMEYGDKDKKSDDQLENLINQMEKPFKKLCNYFSVLKKEIKEINSCLENAQKQNEKTQSQQACKNNL